MYVSVPDLLKCKTSNHQTLHSTSPRCTDSAGIDPVTLTYILSSSAFYTFYVDIQYLLNYKAYNHQTLHSASPQCTDSAGTLTLWSWPIFCTPVTLTHFTLLFDISSNIRPTTTKPCIVLHLIVLAWQVPWPSDLDLYLTHFTLMFDNSSAIRPTTTINVSCRVLLHDVLTWQVPWPGDLDLYFMLQWLLHILRQRSIIIGLYNTKSQCWRFSH